MEFSVASGPLSRGPENASLLSQYGIRGPSPARKLFAVDPSRGFIIREPYTIRAATGAGTLGWTQVVSGTGAATDIQGINGVSSGINQRFHTLSTGTDTTGLALLYLFGTSTDGFALNTTVNLEYGFKARVPDLSIGAQEFLFRMGVHERINATKPATGIYFEYDRTIRANWSAVTINTTETSADTGILVAEDTWVDFYFKYDFRANKVYFYINEVLVATNSANIPTGTSPIMAIAQNILKSSGTTNRDMCTTGFWFSLNDL